MRTVGYELLFRDHPGAESNRDQSDRATAAVVVTTMLGDGLDTYVGRAQAFINIPQGFLLADQCRILPPDRVVLELLETVEPTREALAAVTELVERGYHIALDDFVPGSAQRAFLSLANVVKLDVAALGAHELRRAVADLRRPKLRLLAEKVETHDEYLACRELGFDLFQGFFLCRPRNIVGQPVPQSRAAVAQLLSRLHDPEADIVEIQRVIERDATLCWRVLKIANSAMYVGSHALESIRDAVVRLGLRLIRDWLTIVSLARLEDKPSEILRVALVRARMCELVGATLPDTRPDRLFTVGLLSLLDAMLDQPMGQILEDLHLSHDLRAALLHGEGALGRVLLSVQSWERASWDDIDPAFPSELFGTASVSALRWMHEAQALTSDA